MGLEIRHLKKAFGGHTVLDGLSLEVGDGETVVVFGPSGTGKTLLLRLVAGAHEASGGRILVDGRDVTNENPEHRGVGMAFQNFALFPHMSAYDNIASGLSARTKDKAAIDARVQATARLLKIDHVLGHQPRELSNGQKQRTALARALVGEPKVLLLDDPLRNVDAKLRYEMRLELPTLLKRFGSASLYVTQDYREAMALGDRIAVLLDGRIAQLATPAEIYEAPATIAVARLFGDPTINLLDVEPHLNGAGLTVSIANTRVSLPGGYAAAAGRPAVLGLRPEDVVVDDRPQGAVAVPVEVVAVTPLNERAVVLMRTDDGRELFAAEPGEAISGRRHGPAFASFDPARALVFDRADGRRIAPTH